MSEFSDQRTRGGPSRSLVGRTREGWLALLLGQLLFCSVPTVAQSDYALAYTFTTFAGEAAAGNADGVGSNARFDWPYGIAVDSAGNLYVADCGNHTIRKISAAGTVSTLAGFPGASGSDDGTGSNARFNQPCGITVDSTGTLYVADTYNNTIRRITAAGIVNTLAGLAGSSGSDDGTGSQARFYQPCGIAMDSAGTLYVADTCNNTIRKISAAGLVSTVAGLAGVSGSADGAGSNARFDWPYGLAVDSTCTIYVTDGFNNTIRRITAAGVVSTLAGLAGSKGSADGVGREARFWGPHGITVNSAGNLYVVDGANNTIRKVTRNGTTWIVSTFAGSAGVSGGIDDTGSYAQFWMPSGIAVDGAGALYVTDSGNHTIRKISAAGVVSTLAGLAWNFGGSADGTRSDARFTWPEGVAVDRAGTLYLTDTANNTIRKLTAAGVVSTLAGLAEVAGSSDGTGNNARFWGPDGIAVDGEGTLYVADTGNHTIRKVTAAGVVSTLAGLAGAAGSADGTGSHARFNNPYGIAVDNTGTLYVTDGLNDTIRKITRSGTNWVVSTLAGLAGAAGSTDGTGGNSRFFSPAAIAVDSAGTLYVADNFSTIRKIMWNGTDWVVSTLAGLAGTYGSADGTGGNARFAHPAGIAVDNTGSLYVSDRGENNTIRRITVAGVVSTIGGLAGAAGSADGTGSEARFASPSGIAVDSKGTLYVADTGNNSIRRGVFTQHGAASRVSNPLPPMGGRLMVTLVPPEVRGQWRFPWELGWHDSGYTATNLVAGNYPIEFRSVPGWLALPLQPVQVETGGSTAITHEYYPTISPADTNSLPGSLTVSLGPTPPSGAGWRFLGDTGAFLSTGFTTNLLPGIYLIEFAFVGGRVKPPSQAVQIDPGQPSFLSVNYLLAATPPEGVYRPFRVPPGQVSDLDQYPFGFNGQLQTDTGYGSGVAVETNVVLTAAHLVFNDQTLSYVNRAHWFSRREAGVTEPLPLEARGFYLLSGYAAQRTNDLASGYWPGQSTPPSRNLDVAALYFLSPVAGGGHGGYLPSDAVPNTWLASTARKMLVGYPVDGSQFGDESIVAGKMYQTEPQPYPLSLAPDPVPGQQQVYLASWFLSYPGGSGGPLYVQLNDYYYPAGVYLGTLFSGERPYASLVRAIDSSVTDLILQAAALGDSGTNNTGGGVITIVPSQGVSTKTPGFVQFWLGPPEAVQAGAGWRVQGDEDYGTATNFIRAVTSRQVIEFKPIAGWDPPANLTIKVGAGERVIQDAMYTAIVSPALGISWSGDRLVLSWPASRTFTLQETARLDPATWLVSTNTITIEGSNQTATLAPSGGTRFYRLIHP